MMRSPSLRVGASAAVLLALLTGCGGTDSSADGDRAGATSSPSSTGHKPAAGSSTSPARAAETPSGPERIAVGQKVAVQGSDDDLEFTTTRVTPDAACTSSPAPGPAHGHFVRLDVTARDTGRSRTAMGESFQALNWYYVAPDGKRTEDVSTIAANTCLKGADQIANPVSPDGQETTGAVLLDVPASSGTLVIEHLAGRSYSLAL